MSKSNRDEFEKQLRGFKYKALHSDRQSLMLNNSWDLAGEAGDENSAKQNRLSFLPWLVSAAAILLLCFLLPNARTTEQPNKENREEVSAFKSLSTCVYVRQPNGKALLSNPAAKTEFPKTIGLGESWKGLTVMEIDRNYVKFENSESETLVLYATDSADLK